MLVSCRDLARVVCAAAALLTLTAGRLQAQDVLDLRADPEPAQSLFALPATGLPELAPANAVHPLLPRPDDRRVMLPLYAGFAALQLLDAHSTVRAINHGGVERNPIMRSLAGKPALLLTTKAAVTFSTIVAGENLRRRSRLGSIVMMAAVNSAYAAIVINNYRSAR